MRAVRVVRAMVLRITGRERLGYLSEGAFFGEATVLAAKDEGSMQVGMYVCACSTTDCPLPTLLAEQYRALLS